MFIVRAHEHTYISLAPSNISENVKYDPYFNSFFFFFVHFDVPYLYVQRKYSVNTIYSHNLCESSESWTHRNNKCNNKLISIVARKLIDINREFRSDFSIMMSSLVNGQHCVWKWNPYFRIDSSLHSGGGIFWCKWIFEWSEYPREKLNFNFKCTVTAVRACERKFKYTFIRDNDSMPNWYGKVELDTHHLNMNI